MMESSRVTEAASGAGVYRRDVTSSLQREAEGPREVDAIAVLQVLANHKMRILQVTLGAALLAVDCCHAASQDVHGNHYGFAAAAKSIERDRDAGAARGHCRAGFGGSGIEES